jgi:hypothetical protein
MMLCTLKKTISGKKRMINKKNKNTIFFGIGILEFNTQYKYSFKIFEILNTSKIK